MTEKRFSKKIHYLYDNLGIKGKEFTKLFWDGDKKKFASRHTTVHKSWLGKGINQVKGFYFDDYEISTYKIGNELVFTLGNFMDDDFKKFKKRVDRYINYIFPSKKLIEYQYIYYYSRTQKRVVYAKLNTLAEIEPSKYEVELIPSPLSARREIRYKGFLEINNERYYISVRNQIETTTFYFVLGRGYTDNSKVYGIRLGITYRGGFVEANKELLSKEKLTEEEEKEFYFNVDRDEPLVVDEVLFFENRDFTLKQLYLNKVQKQLNGLVSFMNKLDKNLNKELGNDIYWNIFSDSVKSVNEVSKKVLNEQLFLVYQHKNSIKIFLENISKREDSSCVMLYPILDKDATLIDEKNERTVEILDLIKKLVNEGLNLKIIFIIKSNFEIPDSIKKLIKVGVNIKFSSLVDVNKLKVSSYYFLLPKEQDMAIYTNLNHTSIFKVTKTEERILELSDDFKKIDRVSFSLEKLVDKQNFTKDKILERLVGTWHYYAYGSLIVDITEFRLWHSMVIINKDSTAHYQYKNMTQHSGNIDTTYNPNQSYIRFTNHDSSHLALIMIDHKNIYKDIFKITMLRKQFGITLDMASFGIFSRIKLDESLVKKALGKIDEVMLRENIELEKRINELYIESRF